MSWPLEIKGVVESFLGVQVPTSNTEVRKKWGFHSKDLLICQATNGFNQQTGGSPTNIPVMNQPNWDFLTSSNTNSDVSTNQLLLRS